jgi:hypothetical protein
MVVINIEQEKINWKPVQTKSGIKHYASIAIDYLKEVDDKGNTHAVWNNQTQEERAEKQKKNYCGRGKEYAFTKKEYSKPVNQQESEETLPF